MIPVACASDIDDSNLAADDSINSNENLEFEDLSIEDGDSSDDNSLAVKEEDNQDKKSMTQDELLENSDNPFAESYYDEWDVDEDDDWDLKDDEDDDWDDEKYYNELIASILKKNHSNKTIVDTYTHFDPRLEIFALFLDKKMKPLNNTKVFFKVNGKKFSIKTDEHGFISAVVYFDRFKLKYFYVSLFNPVTGERYDFPEIYFDVNDSSNYAGSATIGFSSNGNAHYFTLNSYGIKSTIKNEKGTVSKAVTYSKGNVIISTKSSKSNSSSDEGDSEKIVIDRLTRYSIYLIGILCIVIPIGIFRYRKKGS